MLASDLKELCEVLHAEISEVEYRMGEGDFKVLASRYITKKPEPDCKIEEIINIPYKVERVFLKVIADSDDSPLVGVVPNGKILQCDDVVEFTDEQKARIRKLGYDIRPGYGE